MELAELVPAHKDAVLLISDERYLPAARFVTAQILRQGSSDFDIVVMTFDCKRESQALFDPRVKVVDIEPDPRLHALTHSARKSTATYLRLSAIERLRSLYSKVLYVDCDIWIGNRPIGRLFDLNFGDHAIAAVRDAAEIIRPRSPEWIEYRAKLGLPSGAGYFNTGIMLIDVEKFCRGSIGSDAITYLASGRYRGPFHDQSALNAILASRWLEISPLWNWTFATRPRITDKYDPAIIHFIGSNKPWSDRTAKHLPKYRAEMQRYLAAFGEQAYVESVPAGKQWRRTAINRLKDAKMVLLGDRRDDRINRYMATGMFADVEAGIVTRSW
jgi:lipopolysaccharide biosynthesis glycosyltransferase